MLLYSTLLIISQVLTSGAPAAPTSVQSHTSQKATLSMGGRVLNELGEPLPGVIVGVQGSPQQVTSTNSSGNFLLALNNSRAVLVFKCQGYRDQVLAVSSDDPLTVKMRALIRTAAATSAADPEPASTEDASSQSTVLVSSDVLPKFPGGDEAYRSYIGHNARFPEEALKRHISGTVYVSFVVDEQGRITNAEILKGSGNGFDEEALRLIRLMPWWSPGLVAGKPVRVARTLAIPFMYQPQR